MPTAGFKPKISAAIR